MSMGRITFDVQLFIDKNDVPRSRKNLLALMHALVFINVSYLKRMADMGKPVPSIYKAGVRYQAEDHTEIWQDIPTIIKAGFGDCEDLACWRCAELNFMGIKARPYLKWRNQGPRLGTMHATLRWPDGRIEDPSAALGMNGQFLPPPVFVSTGPMT